MREQACKHIPCPIQQGSSLTQATFHHDHLFHIWQWQSSHFWQQAHKQFCPISLLSPIQSRHNLTSAAYLTPRQPLIWVTESLRKQDISEYTYRSNTHGCLIRNLAQDSRNTAQCCVGDGKGNLCNATALNSKQNVKNTWTRCTKKWCNAGALRCNSWKAKPGFMTMVHLHILTLANVRSTDAYFVLVNLPQLAMDALLA